MTVHGLFADAFRARAETPEQASRTALSADGEILSYAALHRAVLARAEQMAASGLKPGDRIALLQDRSAGLAIDVLAGIAAGLPITVLSRREAVPEAASKLAAADFCHLIVDMTHAGRGRDIARDAGLTLEIRADTGNDTPGAVPGAAYRAEPDDEALIIFTSGSSGLPKAVRISHGNIALNTAGLSHATPLGPDDHLLHVMPLSHTNGILNQLLAPLAQGARVTLLSRFAAEDFVSQMVQFQPTVITGVPTMYQRLLQADIPAEAVARLRMIRCGSAPLALETQKRIEAHFGVEVIVSYGQTETTCTNTANSPGARRLGSVGRVLPGQELAILAVDSDRPVTGGEAGEVSMRGKSVALGFAGQPPFQRDKWFRTGDCGYLDPDGYLFLTGRLKEIIIRGGENLSPGRIEEALLRHQSVGAACVCGLEDEDLGEVPVAFVELEGGSRIELDEANDVIVAALSPSHRLRDIFVVEKLPTNRVGKVDRKALSRMARGQTAV